MRGLEALGWGGGGLPHRWFGDQEQPQAVGPCAPLRLVLFAGVSAPSFLHCFTLASASFNLQVATPGVSPTIPSDLSFWGQGWVGLYIWEYCVPEAALTPRSWLGLRSQVPGVTVMLLPPPPPPQPSTNGTDLPSGGFVTLQCQCTQGSQH